MIIDALNFDMPVWGYICDSKNIHKDPPPPPLAPQSTNDCQYVKFWLDTKINEVLTQK